MSRTMKVFAMIAVAGFATAAQAGGGHFGPPMGGPGGPGGHGMDGKAAAMVLVRSADADQSHDVTADEWSAFLASLTADDAGVVSLDSLAAALPVPPHAPAEIDTARRDAMLTRAFDADADGVVTLADLEALFASMDTNGDGAVSEDDRPAPGEKPAPGEWHGKPGGPHGDGEGEGGHEKPQCQVGDAGKAAALLARAADADDSGGATADEFAALLATLGADEAGAVSLDALAAAIGAPAADDTTERDARLVRTFDFDGDGVVTTGDLQSFFDGADRNGDGVAEKSELRGRKHLKGGDKRAAGMIFRIADGDKSRDVSADEWAAFLASLEADASGAVSLDALAAQLPAPKRGGGSDADTTKRDAALVRTFDRDGDGIVTLADLQALFDMVDANADGALDSVELKPRR